MSGDAAKYNHHHHHYPDKQQLPDLAVSLPRTFSGALYTQGRFPFAQGPQMGFCSSHFMCRLRHTALWFSELADSPVRSAAVTASSKK